MFPACCPLQLPAHLGIVHTSVEAFRPHPNGKAGYIAVAVVIGTPRHIGTLRLYVSYQRRQLIVFLVEGLCIRSLAILHTAVCRLQPLGLLLREFHLVPKAEILFQQLLHLFPGVITRFVQLFEGMSQSFYADVLVLQHVKIQRLVVGIR